MRSGKHLLVAVMVSAVFFHLLVLTPAPAWQALALDSTEEPSAAAEAAALEAEQDPDAWPRVVAGDGFQVEIHPPQFNDWNGRSLEGQAAVEIVEEGKEGSTYGVVDMVMRTRVDKDARLVVIDEFQAVRANVPSAPDVESKLLGFLQKKLYDAVRVVSLDRVETALAVSETRQGSGESIAVKNEPPRIVLVERPTLLVLVDGSPVWRDVEETGFERLLNTRPLLLRDGSGTLFLHLFDGWLEADRLDAEWTVAASPPPGLDGAAKRATEIQPADMLDGGGADQQEVDEEGQPIEKPTLEKGPVPDILVATEPTELIVTEGAPEWTAIPRSRRPHSSSSTTAPATSFAMPRPALTTCCCPAAGSRRRHSMAHGASCPRPS
jgi:hypothetical protein